MSDITLSDLGFDEEVQPKERQAPLPLDEFAIDVPPEAEELASQLPNGDALIEEAGEDITIGDLLGLPPTDVSNYLKPLRQDPETKGFGQAIIDRFEMERLTVRMGQLGNEARKAYKGGDAEKVAQLTQEYDALSSRLPSLDDVAPVYPPGMIGSIRGFGRRMVTGALGLIGQQFEIIAGEREVERYYEAAKEGPLSAAYLRFAAGHGIQHLKGIGEVEGGHAYMDMVKAGVDPRIADLFAQGIGTINNLLEFTEYATFVKLFPGADKVISKATSGLLKKLLLGPAMKNTALRLTSRLALTAGEQLAQEIGQEAVTFYGENWAIEINNATKGTELEGNKNFMARVKDLLYNFLPAVLGLSALPIGMQAMTREGRAGAGPAAQAAPEAAPAAAAAPAPEVATAPEAATGPRAKKPSSKEWTQALVDADIISADIAGKQGRYDETLRASLPLNKKLTVPELLKRVESSLRARRQLRGTDYINAISDLLPQLVDSGILERSWNAEGDTLYSWPGAQAPEAAAAAEVAAIPTQPVLMDVAPGEVSAREAEMAAAAPTEVETTRTEARKRFREKRGEPPDTLLHPERQKEVTPVTAKQARKQLEGAYETHKNIYFKQRDKRIVLEIPNLKKKLQTKIKASLGQQKYTPHVQDIDAAIQIYTDSKRNPTDIDRYYDLLTDEQKKAVDLSQNLPAELTDVIDQINEAYKITGEESLEADVIHNTLENYTARIWERGGQEAAPVYRKFGTTSRHAKARVFDTIIEGWSQGYELKVRGATNNLAILQEEMVKTIENKKFLKSMSQTRGIDGAPLLTTKELEGYKEVKHPNFVTWRYAGKADPGEVYGKNFFVTDEGTLLEKTRMYAPEKIAKNLNNIFGVSVLKGFPGVDTVTKFNAIFKSWILQSSFFHHMAFMRSYYLGAGRKRFQELSIRQAYKEGQRAIENMKDEIVLGVENGLTLGLRQDWDESLVQEKTALEKFLDKNKTTRAVANKIADLRQKHVDFLFGEFGAGLKAKAFLIDFAHEMKIDPNAAPDIVAKRVANLINDDFGGLHLERMGRNPTVQHIFRIFALAPDWTESNVRSMVKAITAGTKEERQLYQRFWARVLVRGAALTTMANFLMAGGDPEEWVENYKRAWKAGDLRWMDVDITPLYKLFGGDTNWRKYFSIFGHFKDPAKFILHPIKSAHYKGSVMYGIFHEIVGGADWAGRRFTTLRELLHTGGTVKWGPGRPLSYEQIPSYFLSQLKGLQPVQIQNLISWLNGEMEGFDAIGNSLGLGVRTTYP